MRAYRTEIVLNLEQQEKYKKTIGVCRFVYNLMISKNKELYEENKDTDNKKYINNYEFSKWLNNEFSKVEGNSWIKDVSSKSIRYTIDTAHKAFIRFFKHLSEFPKFKKKGKNECGMYFVKTDNKSKIFCDRHRIRIPTLGWCKLKEFGYIPTFKTIKSGIITKEAGRYYVSVLVDEINKSQLNTNEGIGIDLGLRDLAILSDGTKIKTLKNTKIYKRLSREQKTLSRKYESKNNKKGEVTCKNIKKQITKVQKVYQKIKNARNDYQNKAISQIIKRKPIFITIEDLNIKGLMKNRSTSKSFSNQSLTKFIDKLKYKCLVNGIELRQVGKFYPSSKLCSCCGFVKYDLKRSDTIYNCPQCKLVIDRDINAGINLKNAKEYKVIA